MRHYYILTLDPNAASVAAFIQRHHLRYELHLNRTRFWVPSGPVLTEFVLRFDHCCSLVDDHLDLATGLPLV